MYNVVIQPRNAHLVSCGSPVITLVALIKSLPFLPRRTEPAATCIRLALLELIVCSAESSWENPFVLGFICFSASVIRLPQ
jgi:hypothetical protein